MGWITKPSAPRNRREVRPRTRVGVTLTCLVGGCVLLLAGGAAGYTQYSAAKNDPDTNCRLCHGDFRAAPYTSLSDGASWEDDLHDVHRNTMLAGDCDTCHSSGKFPVLIGSSNGGTGLDPISCSGCHGRAADAVVPVNGSEGFGAGLRQHHWRADVTVCRNCHEDADPALFTPVEEDSLPPYYADSDPDHPLIPADPCNRMADSHPEDYAASTLGLDNDGDDLYDEADVIACPEPGKTLMLASGLGFLFVLGRRRR